MFHVIYGKLSAVEILFMLLFFFILFSCLYCKSYNPSLPTITLRLLIVVVCTDASEIDAVMLTQKGVSFISTNDCNVIRFSNLAFKSSTFQLFTSSF